MIYLWNKVTVHGNTNYLRHPTLWEIVGADMNPAVRVDADKRSCMLSIEKIWKQVGYG